MVELFSVSCRDLPMSDVWDFCGRNDGMKKRTRPERMNCTTMCIDVVNSGNAKLRRSSSNIHLLYCKPILLEETITAKPTRDI